MGRLSRAVLLGIAFALSACADPISDAQTRVAASTKDRHAVQFRNVRIAGSAICGELNAKNASGRYDGFMPFLAEWNDYGVIYPEFPPDVGASSVAELTTLLRRDRDECFAAATLREEAGILGNTPQCAYANDDKRQYVALKLFAARFRKCSGRALPKTGHHATNPALPHVDG